MAYALSNDEIEIEAEMSEAASIEDQTAAEELHEWLEKLANQYKVSSKVNPKSEIVLRILDLTNCNSWSVFQREHKDLLAEYMDETLAAEGVRGILQDPESKDSWKKKRIESTLAKLRNEIKRLQEKQTEKLKRVQELRTEKLRLNAQLAPLKKKARISPTIKEQCEEIIERMAEIKEEYEEIAEVDYQRELIDKRHEEIQVQAELTVLQNAEMGKFQCFINTSDTRWNCLRYNSLANDCAFELSRKLDDEEKWMDQLATQRYTPQDLELLGATEQGEKESYPLRRLRECRDSMTMIHEFFAEVEYGYVFNEEIFMSQNDGLCPLYPPKDGRPHRWMTLNERIRFFVEKKLGNGTYAGTVDDDALFAMPL